MVDPLHPGPGSLAEGTRRWFLGRGSLALASLWLAQRSSGESGSTGDPAPHHRARARRVIYVHMAGSPPPQDLLDPKPALHFVETLRATVGDFVVEGRVDGLPTDVHALELSHPDGRRAVVAWRGTEDGGTTKAALPFTSPHGAESTLLGDVTRSVPAGPLLLEVSETPVVVVWAGD